LNGFLRGAKKVQIDAVLGLSLIGIVIAAFAVAGWKQGLLAIVISFLSAVVTRPIAARLASRLFGSGDGGRYVGLPTRSLQEICHELGRPFDQKELFSDSGRRGSAKKALLDYCEQQPSTQALLIEFKISRQDLQELYTQLIMVGAGQWVCGHWVAASAIAYPEALKYVLSRRGKNIQETAYNLIMHFEQGSALET
jgi:hypothetical protein